MSELADFDRMIVEFMNDFGGAATLVVQAPGVYDYTTNTFTATEIEVPVRAILLDLTLQSNGLQTVSGTLIEAGDKRCFIQPANKNDPLATMPKINPNSDKLKMGGVSYRIVTLKDTDPDTTNSILLELYVRK